MATEIIQKIIKQFPFCNQNHNEVENLLQKYIKIVTEYNQEYNIIGKSTLESFFDRHILDSLSLLQYCQYQNLIDLGSGCGIPALIVAIFCPTINITMVEKAYSKITFLNIAKKLVDETYPERKIKILHCQVSEINENDLENGEYLLTARAFKSMVETLQVFNQMRSSVKKKISKIVLFKGDKYISEVVEAQKKFHFIYQTSLNLNEKGVMIEIPTENILAL